VARGKKKVGGIKARPSSKGRAPVPAVRSVAKKKVGGVAFQVTEAASSKHRYCAVGCEGEWREGMWCHDNGCSELRMIWEAHGQTLADWTCFHGCPGQELPSGWTHHPECLFWSLRPELTPFHTAGEERKESLRHRAAEELTEDLLKAIS
jgi:hypothetical protein